MNLNEIIDVKEIYAHKVQGKERETLEEHSQRCIKYFHRILLEKKLSNVFHNLFDEFIPQCPKEIKDYFNLFFEYAILFHDAGKINPAFQRIAMDNPHCGIKDLKSLDGTNHSLFSAIIYLDYCLYLLSLCSFEKKMMLKLRGFVYVNSYIISRHHSDLCEMEDYASIFMEGGACFEVVKELSNVRQSFYKGPFYFKEENVESLILLWKNFTKDNSRNQQIGYYVYMRMLYSVLVASDYYATAEYMNGVEIIEFGTVKDTDLVKSAFEKAELTSRIRNYQKERTKDCTHIMDVQDMNILRSELFLEAEKTWKKNEDENIFFLEAPTGSGKSNTSMNLSFQMLKGDIQKIYYVYPFNTLVEQNLAFLEETFNDSEEILSKVAIINSITPIKAGEESNFQEALLDRQFLNYPYILTTHISLFKTLFENEKEDLFGFLQIANSVIILDEIQSYKNTLWSEIIIFLKSYARLLNIKIIIMSATLPNLEVLTGNKEDAIYLLKDREHYFSHPIFKKRVEVSYELLEAEVDFEILYQHISKNVLPGRKIVIEFITKRSAYAFHSYVAEKEELNVDIELMTGDNNQPERKQILKRIKSTQSNGILLIATQVIEAGVDIDMDIGYKDISKLDSEEQFLGRINRSCKKSGTVYFFNYDSTEDVYTDDIRKNVEFTLKVKPMKRILLEKNFSNYYLPILNILKLQWNENQGKYNLEEFFTDSVGKLNFKQVAKRMELIKEDLWHVSVFLAREILLETGDNICGAEVWKEYGCLLQNNKMDYAEKQIKLSRVKGKMSYFIYQISRKADLIYDDKIGDLIYIDNGEQYFVNGKLDRESLEKKGSLFI